MRRLISSKSLLTFVSALVVMAFLGTWLAPTQARASQSGTWGGCTWTLSDAGVLDIAPTNGTSGKLADFTQSTVPWARLGYTSVKVEQGVVAADDMSFAFADSDSCTSFDLTGLSMSTCTSMYEMFSGCSAVESLDLSSLDTSNVTNMEATFQGCSKLSSLNLKGSFTTSGVTSMASMFTYDKSLSTIDLSHFDTQKTVNMNGMFLGCAALTTLDLSGFDTTLTKTMYSIFTSCDSLVTLTVGAQFSFVNGDECELPSPSGDHATGYWVSTYSGQYLSADQIENGYSLFADTYTAEYDNHGICGDCTWTCENGVLDIKPTNGVSGTLGNLYSPTALPSSSYCRKNLTPWGHAKYTTAKIEPGVIANERFSGAFFRDPSDIDKPSLTSVDISNLDTTNTIKAECVFFGNNKLTSIDMANKFANATTTFGMFDTCNSLETISNLTTPATRDTGYMFYDCSKLTSIDLPKVVTSNASYMKCMFKGCSGLTNLDFSSCEAFTPNSTSGLFADCTELTTLNLTNLSSTNCSENDGMFSGCTALAKVTIGDGFSFNASSQGTTTTCTLPTPEFAGATGEWFSWNDGLAYTADQITTADKKVADTFTAQTTGNDIALAKVTGVEKSYVYTGSQIMPIPTIAWTDGTALVAGTDYEVTYGANVSAGSGVGSIIISGKGNYTGSAVVNFDIAKAPSSQNSVTASAYSGVYDAQAHGIAVSEPKAESTIQYSTDDEKWSGVAPAWADITTAQTVFVKVSNPNYEDFTTSATVTIDPKPVTVTANDATKVYGDPDPALTATVEGTLGSDTVAYTLARAEGGDVGSYAITPAGDAAQGNYVVTYKPGTLTVTKAAAEKDAVTPTGYDGTYDGALHAVGATSLVSSGTTISYSTDGGTTWSETAPSFTDVCDVTVQVKAENMNYETATAEAKATITARSLVVKGDSREFTFDGTAHSLDTCSITVGTLVGSDAISAKATGSVTNVADGPVDNVVGDVTFTSGKATNYSVTKESGKLTVTAADISTATMGYLGGHVADGNAYGPTPALSLASGYQLVAGTDYDVSYVDASGVAATPTAVGTYSYVATGRGNFQGTLKAGFAIVEDPSVNRLWGNGGLDTMEKIVDEAYPEGTTSSTVVLCNKDGYWDALSASGVAGLAKAPILLTAKDSLSTQAADEIVRLKPTKVIVVGGTGVVYDSTADAAVAASKAAGAETCAWERLWGGEKGGAAETAVDVFKRGADVVGGGAAWGTGTEGRIAFLATNQSFQDALAISPYAYAMGCPIFLTSSATDISDANAQAIADGGFEAVYVIGGSGVIPASIIDKLQAKGVNVSEDTRLWGNGAIETSLTVANWECSHGFQPDSLAVTDRDGYYDALCGAPLCGENSTVILLAEKAGRNTKSLDGFITAHKSQIAKVFVLGGEAAVTPATWNHIQDLLRS